MDYLLCMMIALIFLHLIPLIMNASVFRNLRKTTLRQLKMIIFCFMISIALYTLYLSFIALHYVLKDYYNGPSRIKLLEKIAYCIRFLGAIFFFFGLIEYVFAFYKMAYTITNLGDKKIISERNRIFWYFKLSC